MGEKTIRKERTQQVLAAIPAPAIPVFDIAPAAPTPEPAPAPEPELKEPEPELKPPFDSLRSLRTAREAGDTSEAQRRVEPEIPPEGPPLEQNQESPETAREAGDTAEAQRRVKVEAPSNGTPLEQTQVPPEAAGDAGDPSDTEQRVEGEAFGEGVAPATQEVEPETDPNDPFAVVAAAPESVPALPPEAGKLEERPLPRVIFELYTAGFTGSLTLTKGTSERVIHFQEGTVRGVDSRQSTESLGQRLIEHGRITEDELEKALGLSEERSIRLGDALVAMDILSRDELILALEDQLESKLVHTFAWRSGTYHIRGAPRAEGVPLRVNPLSAIWRGVLENYDKESLVGCFKPYGAYYMVAAPSLERHRSSLKWQLRSLALPTILNGRTQLGSALAGEENVLQGLYALLSMDLLTFSPSPGAPYSEHDGAAADLPTIEAVQPVEDPLTPMFEAARAFDYRGLLGLTGELTEERIVAAHEQGLTYIEQSSVSEDRRSELRRALAVARDELLLDAVSHEVREATHRATRTRKAQTLSEEGRAALEAEDFLGARAAFEQAIGLIPNDAALHLGLSRALIGSDEIDTAAVIECLEEALRHDPSNAEAHASLAHQLAQGGDQDREKAKAHAKQALRHAPENDLARGILEQLEAPTEETPEPPDEVDEERVNQRVAKGLNKRISVKYYTDGKPRAAFTQKVSDTHIALNARMVEKKGTRITVTLRAGTEDIELTGTVVWVRRVHRALAALNQQSGFGVALESPPESWVRYVRSLV